MTDADTKRTRSLLGRWLGDLTVAEFKEAHLGRMPVARPFTASEERKSLEWGTLERLLQRPGLDVLVVHDGRALRVGPPGSGEELARLLEAGVGLVVRRAQEHDATLARLAGELARDLPGEVQVQLFATSASTSGFGWHYDAEEVFVVQTEGEKDYYFRRNTLDPEPVVGAQPDFSGIRQETTPVMTATLIPGDWLYLPRGWWHAAKARTHSLSISIGVAP